MASLLPASKASDPRLASAVAWLRSVRFLAGVTHVSLPVAALVCTWHPPPGRGAEGIMAVIVDIRVLHTHLTEAAAQFLSAEAPLAPRCREVTAATTTGQLLHLRRCMTFAAEAQSVTRLAAAAIDLFIPGRQGTADEARLFLQSPTIGASHLGLPANGHVTLVTDTEVSGGAVQHSLSLIHV